MGDHADHLACCRHLNGICELCAIPNHALTYYYLSFPFSLLENILHRLSFSSSCQRRVAVA
jgi:hypothetical protein